MDGVISLVRLMADNKKITIYNNVLSGTDLNADPTMISTILRNLISNAVKFCYSGGSVGVDVTDEADGQKCVSVWDTGVVIPPETVSHIVNARQVASTHGTKGEAGTGLGLQLCNNFLALHNSRLQVSSSEEKTVFSFVI